MLRGVYFWEDVPTSLPFSSLVLISLTRQLAVLGFLRGKVNEEK